MPTTTVTDRPEYVIADAIAAAINAATFTGPISSLVATVDEAPDNENLDSPSNTTPHVYVVPGPEIDLSMSESRGGDLHELDVLVIISKRLAADTERRALVDLRWQLQDRLRIDRDIDGCLIAGVPTWWELREVNVETSFSREGLRGPKVFSAGMRLKFSAMLSRRAL